MHSRLPSLLITLLLFLTELIIALYVDDSFIRPFVGDVLAVMLVYFGVQTVFPMKSWYAVALAVGIGCGVERLQYIDIVTKFDITTPRLRTVLGTTFDWHDIGAYLVWGGLCLGLWSLTPERRKNSVTFVLTLARASLFGFLFFVAMFWGKWVTTFGLSLYDFLFLAVIGIQIVLLWTKIETIAELKIILIYHVLGFVMELFKTHPAIGSRSYPGSWFFMISTVPLFSGFMYSAIGSFIFQARHLLDLKFTNYPRFWQTVVIAVLIYINFFTHHFLPDIRYILLLAIVAITRKTKVHFRFKKTRRSMHVLVWLLLTWWAIRVAENIATYYAVRLYPEQHAGRHLVSPQKIIAWFLLFIVSFVVVSAWKMEFGRQQHLYIEETET